MKKTILTIVLLGICVLVWGQTAPPAPLPDSVKIAVVWKNEKDINQYLSNLQVVQNGILNSVIPSGDAQKLSSILLGAIDFIQKNAAQVNPPKQPAVDPKKNK